MKNGASRTNPGIGNPDILRPIGEVDPFAPILVVENEEGKDIGILYSFANHQDSVDGTEISGDWSSIVALKMKQIYGSDFISIMFYGTAGNINQVDVNNTAKDYDPPHSHHYLGGVVADEILKVINDAKYIDGNIKIIYDTKLYQSRVPTVTEIEKYQEIFNSVELPANIKLDAGSPRELFDACMAKSAINYSLTAKKYCEIKMQVVSIGNVIIFALPGEVFSQYGTRIKKAFSDSVCFFACLSNNGPGYMPVKECYLPELYESLYGSARFYPEDTEDIFDTFIELGKKL